MTQDEIDTMWEQAMYQSIKEGELFTRYRFAKLVASKEREACAVLAQKTVCDTHIPTGVKIIRYGTAVAKAIRARGEQA